MEEKGALTTYLVPIIISNPDAVGVLGPGRTGAG
jgi:hypothetical protein